LFIGKQHLSITLEFDSETLIMHKGNPDLILDINKIYEKDSAGYIVTFTQSIIDWILLGGFNRA
jgi:hypothetical protein